MGDKMDQARNAAKTVKELAAIAKEMATKRCVACNTPRNGYVQCQNKRCNRIF